MTEEVVANQVAPATQVDGQVLETSTARDADLPVNQSNVVGAPPSAVVEKPILLTEQDLTKSPAAPGGSTTGSSATPPSTADGLASQIETLSGEIQALEAKIDRLTSNVSVPASAAGPAVNAKPVVDPAAKPPIEMAASLPTTSPVAPLPDIGRPSAPTAAPTAPTDIYAKSASDSKAKDSKTAGSIKIGEEDEAEHTGAVSSIGAILAVVGLIIFLVLLASPLFKEMIPIGAWNAISQIGWIVALGSLGLGLLLMVFSPGKSGLKVVSLLAIILLALIYLGISGYGYLFGPLQPTLDPLFSFYH